jgi:cleavage stimulation factor subunit 3
VSTQREEMDRIESVRLAYRAAATAPVHGVEGIFREYEEWELSQGNGTVAAEIQPAHQIARNLARERVRVRDGLDANLLPVPVERYGERERHQFELARRTVQFEKNFPQRHADPSKQRERIILAYEHALQAHGFAADLYYDYATWYSTGPTGVQDADRAREVLERGARRLPRSLMMQFVLADFEESRKRPEAAIAVYERLLADPPSSLVFIQYMRFARRALGTADARKIFLRAIQSSRCTSHVFLAAARAEHAHSRDITAARAVLELGMRRYPDDAMYAGAYADFLVSIGDSDGARVLFERALASLQTAAAAAAAAAASGQGGDGDDDGSGFSADSTREILQRFVSFEHALGDLGTCARAETRLKEALPREYETASPFAVLVHRYSFMGLQAASAAEAEAYAKVHPPAPVPQWTRGGRQGQNAF